jgi:hypothetical protein
VAGESPASSSSSSSCFSLIDCLLALSLSSSLGFLRSL